MADDGLFSDITGGQPSGGLFDDIAAPQPEPEPEPPRGPSTPVTRFVRQGEAAPERPLPGFGESVAQGFGTALRGGAETGEAMFNRLRGQPLAEPTETIGDPRVEEIKPSEALTSWEKFKPAAGYMLGRSAPAAAGAISGGTAFGLLGEIGGGALSQFFTDYGPRFRENVDAGMSEDQALRTALKSSGVSAAATGASFGVPLTVLKQVLLQPTIAAGETVIQNYLAGRPLTEGVEEAGIAGAAGAAPVIAGKGVGRLIRRRPRGEVPEGEVAPAEPPAAPPAERAPEAAPAEPPPPQAGAPPPPQAGAPLAPTEGVAPNLFDWMVRGGEGEPPQAPEAVRGPAPRIRPEIPREPPRAEPTAPPAPTPAPPEVPAAPAEPRAPERPAPPERAAGLFDDITGEPPAWVTERIPEEAAPAAPAEPRGDVYQQAVDLVRKDDRASTSYIQRRLGLGYNQAADLMDRMEREGVIGPADVRGKRQVLREEPAPAEPPRAQEPAAPPEAPAAPAEPLARRTGKAKQPQSLLQFIAMNGGISAKDPMVADVRAIIGKKNKLIPGYGALIRENGRPLDRILENAVEGRYIEDPGFWQQNVPRTTTIRNLLDAIDTENRGVRQIPRGEEAAPPRADERAPEMEASAQRVRDAMKEAGLNDVDIHPEAVYEAADSLYRGEATDPVAAYDQAALKVAERDYADRTGVRGGGEEVPAPGKPGAGPRVEKTLPAARAEPSRARPARKPPRQEIPQEDLAHLQNVFRDKIGAGVTPLDSVPLSTALKELDVRHLKGAPAAVARFVTNRLGRVVGDVPVHFITDNDMARYMPGHERAPGGVWVEADSGVPGQRRSFILVNADAAADARLGTHILLHEGAHAAAHNAIERNPKFKAAIRSLMDAVEGEIDTATGRKPYAFTNEHEFLSEAFGNPNLQEILAQIPTPPKLARQLGISEKGAIRTAWDTLVEGMRRILGLPSKMRSMLETTMRVGAEITGRDIREGAGRAEAAMEREEPKRRPAEEPGAEGKPQLVIPGAERRQGEMLQRKAAAPLKPKAEQKPMDFGLFGEESRQPDLFGRKRTEAELITDAGNEVLTDKLILHNHSTLSKVAGYLGGTKLNPTVLRVYLQDKFLRIKRMQEQWMRDNPGQPLPESMDTYQAEALSHGKIDKRMRDAQRDLVEPLVKEINGNGLTWNEIGEYAKAKHAQERNRELRKINPTAPDPAGMSDAAAQQILAAARPRQGNFDAAYSALRRLIDATIDMQVRDGLLSPQQAAAWRQRWPDYVPMRHTETGERWIGVGKGLEVRGKEYRQAFGRLTPAENPVQFAVHQLERAIIRGEHNRVGQTLGEFVRNTPEPDLWSATERPKIRYIDPKTGMMAEMTDPNFRTRNDVFTWKENGVEQSVWFKDKDYGAKIVRALKSLDEIRQNKVMRGLSMTTRMLARLSTSYNPEFMLSNFIRDAGEAFINLPSDTQQKFSASFIKNLPGAMYGAMHGQWPMGGGRYAQYFREFERAGGRIGFYGARTVEEAGADVQRQLQRLQGGTINTLKNWRDKTLGAIDTANTGVENGTRLAVYIAAREAGLSEGKAAFMARESTVNFNRRGEARWLSSLYMFANAGLQGTVRSAQALKTSPRARKAAAWLAASGATLAMYNIMAGGTDEDGRSKYSKIPEWERDLNFILMSPDGSGSYVKIPKPFVFGMFAGMGEHLASWMWDNQSIGKTASAIGWNMLQAVDPLGQDQGLAHFFPTLLKPAVQLYTNVGPFGTPIRPDAMPWNKYLPESERRPFRSTSQFSRGFAKQLNELSGGDKATPGMLDTAPGNIDYLLGYASGGLGRFALNMWNSGTRLYQGQEWVPEKTPFLRRFYGEPKPQADKQLYYEAKKDVDAAVQRKTVGPELGAAGTFKAVEKQRKGIQKQTDAINARDDLEPAEKDDLIKELEQRELHHMLNARRALERSRARTEGREPTFAVGGLVQM